MLHGNPFDTCIHAGGLFDCDITDPIIAKPLITSWKLRNISCLRQGINWNTVYRCNFCLSFILIFKMFCLFVKLLNTFDSHIRSAYRVVSLLSIITHMLTRDALYSTFWYSKSCSQKIDTILLQLWIFIKHIGGKVGENTYRFQRRKFQHTCIKKH